MCELECRQDGVPRVHTWLLQLVGWILPDTLNALFRVLTFVYVRQDDSGLSMK